MNESWVYVFLLSWEYFFPKFRLKAYVHTNLAFTKSEVFIYDIHTHTCTYTQTWTYIKRKKENTDLNEHADKPPNSDIWTNKQTNKQTKENNFTTQ